MSECRSGYTLDVSGEWAAPRDASWYDRPNVRSSKRAHVNNDHGQAACSGAPLDENTRFKLADVPEHIRCQRPACRKRWPAEVSA